MRLDIVSIFPDYLAPLSLSLPGKAIATGLVDLSVHDLRDWTHDRHRTVDDTPYGGGAGMVMKPDPWGEALDALASGDDPDAAGPRLLVMTPSGRPFTQAMAEELSAEEHLIIACGRYEGIDARVVDHAHTRMRVDEVSIGDYVLNGGEAAALVITEAVVRLIPGVIGNPESLAEESHAPGHDGLLEYPVFTKPPVWRGLDVPEILFSGHHGKIAAWRRDQAETKTRERRPDLIPGDPTELIIDRAGPDDAGELLTLQRAAYMTEAQLNGTADLPPLTQTLDELRASVSDDMVLQARRGGRLVGSVLGRVEPGEAGDSWYVGRLMVAPDLQGQGIGGRLLSDIEQLAPESCRTFRMVTGAASGPNLEFYARHGYRESGRFSHPGPVDVVILTKPRS